MKKTLILLSLLTLGLSSCKNNPKQAGETEGTEGYGELKDQGTAFVDSDKLNFTSTMPLTKTDCDR